MIQPSARAAGSVQRLVGEMVGLVAPVFGADGIESVSRPALPVAVLVQVEVHEPGADQRSNEESAHFVSRS
jgi:hypothetical protein